MDPAWNSRSFCNYRLRGTCLHYDFHSGEKSSHSGRHLFRARPSSERLHALLGPHDGPYLGFLRLSALTAASGSDRVVRRRTRDRTVDRLAFFPTVRWTGSRSFLAAALMMVLFYHAARLALVVFDPFLSSRPLVEAFLKSPDGKLIVDHNYWTFSSVTFYSNRDALTLNGRYFNLEYGSYAPGAPDVFIDDAQFKSLWYEPQRYYLVGYQSELRHFEELVGQDHLNIVASSGGKVLLTNHPLGPTSPAQGMAHLSAAFKNQLAKPWLYR